MPVLLAFFTAPVAADEVRLFAAGAAKHAVEALAPVFHQATGHTLRASYAGSLPAPHGLSTAYGAALTSESAAARMFLTFLSSDEARHHFERSGFVQVKD